MGQGQGRLGGGRKERRRRIILRCGDTREQTEIDSGESELPYSHQVFLLGPNRHLIMASSNLAEQWWGQDLVRVSGGYDNNPLYVDGDGVMNGQVYILGETASTTRDGRKIIHEYNYVEERSQRGRQ